MQRVTNCFMMVVVAMSTGCAMFNAHAKRDLPTTASLGECQVEFQSSSSKTTSKAIDVYEDSTVQNVLERSGAFKKFGRMEIELARALPNGAWHKMKIDYNVRADQVESSTDYHVQPGDRLLVKEDPSTFIDDMLESSLGPIGKGLTTRRK
jgi:hypothetical protein